MVKQTLWNNQFMHTKFCNQNCSYHSFIHKPLQPIWGISWSISLYWILTAGLHTVGKLSNNHHPKQGKIIALNRHHTYTTGNIITKTWITYPLCKCVPCYTCVLCGASHSLCWFYSSVLDLILFQLKCFLFFTLMHWRDKKFLFCLIFLKLFFFFQQSCSWQKIWAAFCREN